MCSSVKCLHALELTQRVDYHEYSGIRKTLATITSLPQIRNQTHVFVVLTYNTSFRLQEFE